MATSIIEKKKYTYDDYLKTVEKSYAEWANMLHSNFIEKPLTPSSTCITN